MIQCHAIRWATFLSLLLLSMGALAKPTAEGFIKAKQGELSTLIRSDSASSQKKVSAIFDEILDYDALAKESLSKHWDGRSEEERAEFTEILKTLVQRAYRRNLKRTADYDVTFEGHEAVAKGHLVQTVARSRTDKREDPISIDYVLHEVKSSWRIIDIITEGSSLVTNYRRQFGRIIGKKGFPELIKRMRRKLNEEEES
jgi:phospholipid transport system substrate-binding protein